MNGVQIFTDQNHFLSKQQVFPSIQMARAERLEIASEPMTDFIGFGVAITGSSCYQLSLMSPEERKVFLNNIFSKEGLGLSVGRISIGSSDYSAELYSYDDTPFDTELEHFSIERDEKYIIPMLKEILAINPDLFLFASPWSPPGWMKTGGNMCGGYMRNEFVDCYADYIVKFVKAYAEHGIKISAITPQNEPDTQQDGLMPACIWHPEIEAKFIKILHGKFVKHNLDVKIWMLDHNFSDTNRVMWSLEQCAGLAEACDGVAFHYYCGTIEETDRIQKAYPTLSLNFTEGGPRLADHYDDDWCKWGIMIAKCLKHGYHSFTGWNLLLNEMGGLDIGPFMCGGLVTRNSSTGDFTYSGQYKALCHIAPYVTPNSKIYPVSVSESFGQVLHEYPKVKREIIGFAVDNQDGKIVLIVINPNSYKCQSQFCLNQVWWYAELPPESISTIMIE